MSSVTLSRIGPWGGNKGKVESFLNSFFGPYWKIVHTLNGEQITDWDAYKIYEEGYYRYFQAHQDQREWVLGFSNVIDNAPTNVQSGLNYDNQDCDSVHLQDIAIRRALTRLHLEEEGIDYDWRHLPNVELFTGTEPLVVRGYTSKGHHLSPGEVFLDNVSLLQPEKKGWWKPGSIESFWQSNKVLKVAGFKVSQIAERIYKLPPNHSYWVAESELDHLQLEWIDLQSHTVYGTGTIGEDEHFVKAIDTYHSPEYYGLSDFLYRDRGVHLDLITRITPRVKSAMNVLSSYAKTIGTIIDASH